MTDCAITRNGQPHRQAKAHSGTCPGQACSGCLPAPAVPGLHACGEHVDTARSQLRELPTLWAELAEPSTTTPSAGPVPDDQDDDTPTLPAVVGARSQIRAVLVYWCRLLNSVHSVPLPDEQLIARWTRLEVLRAEWERDVAHAAFRDPLQVARRLDHHRTAAGHAAVAEALRARRLGDVDIIDALREHIDRHLSQLLGHSPERADQLAGDIDGIHHRARALAYPSRAAVAITCSCGATVRLDIDPQRIYTCPGCGSAGTLDQWRRWEAPTVGDPISLRQVVTWLGGFHGIELTLKTLQHWRDRRYIVANECCIPYGALGPHRAGCTQVFDPNAVLIVARARLERKRSA